MRCELRTRRGTFDVKVEENSTVEEAARTLMGALDKGTSVSIPLVDGGYVVLGWTEAAESIAVVVGDDKDDEQRSVRQRLVETMKDHP